MPFACWFPIASLLAPVLVEEPPKPAPASLDARAILERTVEELAKVQAASYELEYKATGWLSAFMPNIHGNIVIGKETKDRVKKFRSTLKVQAAGSDEANSIIAGADGEIYYIVDEKTKTVHADIDPGVLGKNHFTVEFSLTREFGMANPFEDTLKGGELRWEGSESVEGEECHVLWLKPKMDFAARWFFSKRDFLPRRIAFVAKGPDGDEGTTEVTIRNLTVNPTFARNPFELVIPDGYRKTDEFAP